jgi:lipopolysaccharide biosynthesis glycosyltransferase
LKNIEARLEREFFPSHESMSGRLISDQHIAIATTSDANYLPAACCQIKSVWDHLDDKTDIPLFLIVCDVSAEDRQEAERFFCKREIPAKLIVADDLACGIQPVNSHWPRSAYLRLYFDSIFPPDIDKLIYFDADTRVCGPLQALLDAPLHGAPVGAVHDLIYYVTGNIHRRRCDLFLGADAPYLQSGVMVFDWPLVLRDGYLARARQFLEKYPERCQEAPDQDALNAVLEGKWTPLDPRWNLHETYLMFGGRLKAYVEHYTSTKPWSHKRARAWKDAASWYTRELAGTAWADFVVPQSLLDRVRTEALFLKFRAAPHVRDVFMKSVPFLWYAMSEAHAPGNELPWAPKSRNDVERMAEALLAEAEQRCPRLLPPEAALAPDLKDLG